MYNVPLFLILPSLLYTVPRRSFVLAETLPSLLYTVPNCSFVLTETLPSPLYTVPHHSFVLAETLLIRLTLSFLCSYRDLAEPPVHSSSHYRPPWMMVEAEHTSVIIFVCIVVVAMAIVMYMRRLGVSVRGARTTATAAADMRRVPTMSYFMTEPGQNQDGVQIVHDHGGYEDTLPFLGVS